MHPFDRIVHRKPTKSGTGQVSRSQFGRIKMPVLFSYTGRTSAEEFTNMGDDATHELDAKDCFDDGREDDGADGTHNEVEDEEPPRDTESQPTVENHREERADITERDDNDDKKCEPTGKGRLTTKRVASIRQSGGIRRGREFRRLGHLMHVDRLNESVHAAELSPP
jgi:hypothetical protein